MYPDTQPCRNQESRVKESYRGLKSIKQRQTLHLSCPGGWRWWTPGRGNTVREASIHLFLTPIDPSTSWADQGKTDKQKNHTEPLCLFKYQNEPLRQGSTTIRSLSILISVTFDPNSQVQMRSLGWWCLYFLIVFLLKNKGKYLLTLLAWLWVAQKPGWQRRTGMKQKESLKIKCQN